MAQPTDGKTTADSNEISIKELILKIREWRKHIISKWKIILIMSLIGSSLGLAYSIFKKPTYKAELSFALEDDNASGMGGLGSAAGLASQFGVNLDASNAGGAFSGDNIMELMKSRTMVENTLLTSVNIKGQNQTLANLYISFNNFREGWDEIPALKKIEYLPGADRSKFTLLQDSILGVFYHAIIKKNLIVEKEDKKLSIISVKVESANELFSKYFTETLVKTVSNFYIETKTKKSSQNVSVLQRQTDSVRRELNAAITGAATSSDVNPNPNPSLQIIKVPSQRKQVDVQADIAIMTELVKNLEISKISLRKETPLVQVIDKPVLPLEKKKVGKVKGIIIGGIISAFLTIMKFLFRKIIESVMNDN